MILAVVCTEKTKPGKSNFRAKYKKTKTTQTQIFLSSIRKPKRKPKEGEPLSKLFFFLPFSLFFHSSAFLLQEQSSVSLQLCEDVLVKRVTPRSLTHITRVARRLRPFQEDSHNRQVANHDWKVVPVVELAVDAVADVLPLVVEALQAVLEGAHPDLRVDFFLFGAVAGQQVLEHLVIVGVGLLQRLDGRFEIVVLEVGREQMHRAELGEKLAVDGRADARAGRGAVRLAANARRGRTTVTGQQGALPLAQELLAVVELVLQVRLLQTSGLSNENQRANTGGVDVEALLRGVALAPLVVLFPLLAVDYVALVLEVHHGGGHLLLLSLLLVRLVGVLGSFSCCFRGVWLLLLRKV